MNEGESRRRRSSLLVIIGIVFFSGLVILVAINRRNVKAGLNTPIRYDDFVFQVENVRVVPGTDSDHVSYHVKFRVDNRAKRVPYTFDERRLVLLDRAGRTYATSAPAVTPADLPAGTSSDFELRYEVPDHTQGLRLKLKSSGPVGDVLEFVFFGDKEFTIPESQ